MPPLCTVLYSMTQVTSILYGNPVDSPKYVQILTVVV